MKDKLNLIAARLRVLADDVEGQDLVEYALLAGFVAVAAARAATLSSTQYGGPLCSASLICGSNSTGYVATNVAKTSSSTPYSSACWRSVWGYSHLI